MSKCGIQYVKKILSVGDVHIIHAQSILDNFFE